MEWSDTIWFGLKALIGARVRTIFMLIAMAIGIAAVIVLTSLGKGARLFIAQEFATLGTNVLIAMPGRSETAGGNPGMFLGETTRDFTLDDALALFRDPRVVRVAPLNVGAASVSFGERDREVPVMGTTSDLFSLRQWTMASGQFLPAGDPRNASAVVVLGKTVRDELFGSRAALGEWVRIEDRRFRVIGILEPQGEALGQDPDDVVIIPVATAQQLFNVTSLFRVMIEVSHREALDAVKENVIEIIKKRHYGEDDITVITQDSILATFDNIIRSLTLGVAGIAAISLGVAGILIMNVMLIAVTQRTAEIGLLKALGASQQQIQRMFLTEAVLLSIIGCITGIVAAQLLIQLVSLANPTLPLTPPWWAIVSALTVAIVTGLLFGVMPAKRAARLDPIAALAKR